MDLIIVESPKKVKDVEKYAKAAGLDAKVLATWGHMIDLPEMKAGPCVDTERFEPTELNPKDDGAARRCAEIRAAAAKADRVIVASDPDREGEAIAAQVWGLIPANKAWRATFDEITKDGIKKGLSLMRRELDQNKVESSSTRRLIDRLAGWHATDLVFSKLRQHKGLSAGRLQSAALRLVVERHRAFTAFKVTKTYGLKARLKVDGVEFSARLTDEGGKAAVFNGREEALARAKPTKLIVKSVDERALEQKPRPPFEATSWLQVAQKALGLTVKDATAAIQSLFETGATTYPRTDSVRVADEAIEWARAQIQKRFGGEYLPPQPWRHDEGEKDNQGAHEAIRPTVTHEEGDSSNRRNGQWGEAYELIELRFLASQAAARRSIKTTIEMDGEGVWRATGERETFAGWRKVLATDAAEEDASGGKHAPSAQADEEGEGSALPKLNEGQTVEVMGIECFEIKTSPRPLFSQASIVAELKRLGIGRPSTYATIIPILMGRNWAEEKPLSEVTGGKAKKKDLPVLVPTSAGNDLFDFLAKALPGLVDLHFTAELEAALDRVGNGKASRLEVGRSWWAQFSDELDKAKQLAATSSERPDLGPCPRCLHAGRAGHLRLITGVNKDDKKAFSFAKCDADTKDNVVCGLRLPVHKEQALQMAPCPTCRSMMKPVERKDGGKSWVCDKHGWFVANKKWEVAKAPKCPDCHNDMQHRAKKDGSAFFWACFEHNKFVDSDVFGSVSSNGSKRRAS